MIDDGLDIIDLWREIMSVSGNGVYDVEDYDNTTIKEEV